jgi:formyl-CoA transferase
MKLVRGTNEEGDTTSMASSNLGDARRALIEQWCAERTMDEAWHALTEIGVPSAPVRTIPEVAKDPHLWEREMLVKMDDAVAGEMYVPGATIKFSKTPARVGPVPTPGQHTDEILGSVLGYDRATLDGLRASGAIA